MSGPDIPDESGGLVTGGMTTGVRLDDVQSAAGNMPGMTRLDLFGCALVRGGDLQGIQIGGRNQWRVERAKLEEYIETAYQRTAANLSEMPSTLPSDA